MSSRWRFPRRQVFETGDGLVRWDGENSKRFLSSDPAAKIGTGAVIETDDGTHWASTHDGLYQLAPGAPEFVVDRPEGAGPIAFGMSTDRSNRLWVLLGSWPHSTARLFCREQGRWQPFPEPVISNAGRPMFLFTDRTGNLWMPGELGGLLRVRDGRVQRSKLPGTAAHSYALCMAEDQEGGLWIGTEARGVIRLKPKAVWTATSEDGLPHDGIWSICQNRDGTVWLGSQTGAAAFKDGQFTRFTRGEKFSHKTVRVIACDEAGRTWLGTGAGLDCVEHGHVRNYRFPGDWSNTKINSLWAGSDNMLWVGTVRGVHRVDLRTVPPVVAEGTLAASNAARILASHTWLNETNQLYPIDVRAVLEDRHRNVWFGTHGDGLARLREGLLTWFSTKDGLSSDAVCALHESRDGAVWIGTERGLTRFADGRFTVLTHHQGLFDDLVNQMIEDDNGDLWIGSDHGIGRVPRSDIEAVVAGRAASFHCVTYDTQDGLLIDETNGQHSHPSGCKTRDGRIWFPTPKGVLVFDPKHLPDVTNPPPCAIEQVHANGRLVYENASAPGGPILMDEFLKSRFRPLNVQTPERSRATKLALRDPKPVTESCPRRRPHPRNPILRQHVHLRGEIALQVPPRRIG